jgi:hypothetical protein
MRPELSTIDCGQPGESADLADSGVSVQVSLLTDADACQRPA